jgi:hypothetical protein
MRSTITSERLHVRPGVPATLDIEVVNTSDVIDAVAVVVHGIDASQVTASPPVVTLFPESAAVITLTFDVAPSHPAGDSMVLVRLESTVDESIRQDHDVWLTVEPVESARLTLRPSVVYGGATTQVFAEITNTGNVETEFGVSAMEPTRIVDCVTLPSTVVVAPGDTQRVLVRCKGKRPWFGQTAARVVQVTAATSSLTLTEPLRFNQKPRIARGVVTALVLAAIIALWAFIFLVVVQMLRGGGEPQKAVPKNWNEGGAQQVSLANVAGAISGTVRAATTNEGVARITVEAYRLVPGAEPELTASGATGDDGTYKLGTLLPGNYHLRFSADGFDPLWFPGTPDQAAAETIAVAPQADVSGKDVKIAGKAGTLKGKIATPPGADAATPAKVTVTLVPASPGDEVPPPRETATTGEFSLDGLPTPATYSVRIERPGFDAQTTEVTLGGGQAAVLDTAALAAADGSIHGIVVDGSGQRLGGVGVTLRGGGAEQKSTTPTTGNIGAFDIVALATPQTYVLTFDLPGYSSATIALELQGGEAKDGLTVTLVGGVGTVRGTVRDAQGNPLGGVTVEVRRGATTATTTTLTSGDGANGVGTYTVSNLAVPGTYTMTFTLAGYDVETSTVTFAGAGEQPPIDIVLSSTNAVVRGAVVHNGGGGVAGATVELSDGTTTRTTQSASTPAGGFEFPGVPPGRYTLRVTGTKVVDKVVAIEVLPGGAAVERNMLVTTR